MYTQQQFAWLRTHNNTGAIMTTILNQADTGKLIKSIRGRAASVQNDIHQAACSTLDHMRQHGDYTLAVALLNVLPSGQRVKGLAAWYKHFSGGKFTVRQDKAQGNIWVGSLKKDRAATDFLVEDAMQVTFADFTTERDPQQITPATILKYLERLVGNEDTLPNGSPKVDPEAVALASKLLAAA
jgi:hypothetical protein